ncbi:MAG: NAD-dependent epimerase/dehydratase family protein [Pseudomonadota bacterium]
MTTCLITGGAGFIGSHLVEACLDQGFRVIVLDDLSTGKKDNLPMGHKNLTFIEGTVTCRDTLLRVKHQAPDLEYIFHLAAIASVTRSMEEPVYTHQVNFEGTLLILDTFKDLSIKKLLYASSTAVYGDTRIMPVREDLRPAPLSPYGADKLAGEYYLKIFNDCYGLPAVSCRFFNVFGERQDPSSPYSGVISIFFDRAISKKQGNSAAISIFGDGGQTRDFIYVKDIVRALLYLAEDESVKGRTFNLGYGKKTSVLELAEKTRSLIDTNIEIRFEKPRQGDVLHSQADIHRLLKTGFTFQYDFDSGLKRLAEFLNH